METSSSECFGFNAEAVKALFKKDVFFFVNQTITVLVLCFNTLFSTVNVSIYNDILFILYYY